MRRQLGVGLLSKIARNGRSTNIVSPKSVSPSPFLKPNSSPFHQRSFSEQSTLSHSHLWKICSPNGVRGTIQNRVFPSSVLSRRFLSEALLQGPRKFPVRIRNTRSLHSFSLDSGRKSFFRRFTTDGVVLGLIVANVAVFALWKVADTRFMVKNFMISVEHIKSGQLHTLITNAFSHRDMFHLISNMVGLYFFGTDRTKFWSEIFAEVVSSRCNYWLDLLFSISGSHCSITPGCAARYWTFKNSSTGCERCCECDIAAGYISISNKDHLIRTLYTSSCCFTGGLYNRQGHLEGTGGRSTSCWIHSFRWSSGCCFSVAAN